MYRTTFSGAFGTGALFKLSKPSIIFNIFINIALYALFTLICFYVARPPLRLINLFKASSSSNSSTRLPGMMKPILAVFSKRMSREQTIAVCFCGAAKTTSLGIPLVTAMWARADNLTRAYIQIPVLLYTIEQVFMAQLLVYFFKWYLRRGRAHGDREEGVANVEAPPMTTRDGGDESVGVRRRDNDDNDSIDACGNETLGDDDSKTERES